jgi:hypothetical protein
MREPFQWKVNIGKKCSVIPDHVFGLEFNNQRCWYFLEADRATMPVTRGNLDQTSFYRKLLAYFTGEQGMMVGHIVIPIHNVKRGHCQPRHGRHLAAEIIRASFLFQKIDRANHAKGGIFFDDATAQFCQVSFRAFFHVLHSCPRDFQFTPKFRFEFPGLFAELLRQLRKFRLKIHFLLCHVFDPAKKLVRLTYFFLALQG